MSSPAVYGTNFATAWGATSVHSAHDIDLENDERTMGLAGTETERRRVAVEKPKADPFKRSVLVPPPSLWPE